MLNTKVKSQLETSDGKLTFCLIREFLEFFDLYFTISVFEPETYMGSAYKYEGRKKTLQDLNIQEIDEKSDVPVLLQLIRKARGICFLKEGTNSHLYLKLLLFMYFFFQIHLKLAEKIMTVILLVVKVKPNLKFNVQKMKRLHQK